MTAQDALARHRLTRAREALADADLLISTNRWNGALNRLYYGDFADAQPDEVQTLHDEINGFVRACEAVVNQFDSGSEE